MRRWRWKSEGTHQDMMGLIGRCPDEGEMTVKALGTKAPLKNVLADPARYERSPAQVGFCGNNITARPSATQKQQHITA